MERNKRQTRSYKSDLAAKRAEENKEDMYIEGYFAVFNKITELWRDAFEQIAPGAFDGTLGNDIRALINHDTTLVLGRNKSSTLELKTDSYGLWGRIKINPKDTDAVNLYERVQRGDVDQCSFGFNVLQEETDWKDDGTVTWTIKEIDLHEVSVCTFPAYEETGVQARHDQVKQYKERQVEQRKKDLKARLNKWH